MNAKLITITPEWANVVLARSTKPNRTVSKKHVSAIAREILGGRWKVNGDTICIDADGNLIDGQHRLYAVLESGMSVQSFVIEGLPFDVYDTIDGGKKRSKRDTLTASGEANAFRLAALLCLIDRYMTGRMGKPAEYSNSEVESLLLKYPDARESIQTIHFTRGMIYPSVIDACHYLFKQKDKALADDFVLRLRKGSGLDGDSPMYLLRERLIANITSKAKLSKVYVMALCIKAWNYERSGTKLRCLRWREQGHSPEPFPVIQ